VCNRAVEDENDAEERVSMKFVKFFVVVIQ
jgi:hypothetical protein